MFSKRKKINRSFLKPIVIHTHTLVMHIVGPIDCHIIVDIDLFFIFCFWTSQTVRFPVRSRTAK